MEYTLPVGEIINIVLCILSFLLAAFSIVFVMLTLRQNKKLIESSTRPYISIYIDSITICEQDSYFVIKNFGHSSAFITHFDFPPILSQLPQDHVLFNEQFDYVKGITLAPGQSCLLLYNVSSLPDEDLSFSISYKSSSQDYSETFTLNPRKYIHIPKPRPKSCIPTGNEREVLTLRELIERLL